MSTPFTRAKASLEKIGYAVGKTEHWNPFAHIRMDLFGCIDAVCMRHGSPLLAIQVTSASNVSSRMKKSHPVAVQWVSTGNRFQVIGYKAGSRKPPRIVEMVNGEWEAVK